MQEALLPRSVARFRAAFRKERQHRIYWGWLHFVMINVIVATVVSYCLLNIKDLKPLEILTLPFSFLYANLAEYLGHKGPMHHRYPCLQKIFLRHNTQHHHFFTDKAMTCDTSADFRIILFPLIMLLFFFGCFAVPIGIILSSLATPNVGYLFVAMGLTYYCNYEWFHLFYHLPENFFINRLPFMSKLRRHHTLHHGLRLMTHYNFNITYPICDILFRTHYELSRRQKPRSGA